MLGVAIEASWIKNFPFWANPTLSPFVCVSDFLLNRDNSLDKIEEPECLITLSVLESPESSYPLRKNQGSVHIVAEKSFFAVPSRAHSKFFRKK